MPNKFEQECPTPSGTLLIIGGKEIKVKKHNRKARIEEFTSEKPVTIRNLRMHILADGEKYLILAVNPPHK
ncbi:MAG: hypothetical protein ACR2KB_04325 [Chitinophagaceae bacterium]